MPTPAAQFSHVTRPVLRYYGGKFRLAQRLVQMFPPHHVYVEPFGGAASVLMQKPRSHAEVYNDMDGEVVNVFRVLQNARKCKRLQELLRVTPFAREEFDLSYKSARTRDEVERARRTIMRSFMGFGSDSITRIKSTSAGFNSRISTMRTGFRYNSVRSNVTAATDWASYANSLSDFLDRMRGVIIENRCALKVIRKMDRADCLFYVDPPYPRGVRNSGNLKKRVEHNYRHEMTDAQHGNLAELLHECKGMVIVSSYPGKQYESLYADWRHWEWTGQQFCHGSRKRTECVWMNEAAYANSPQLRMF